MSAPKETMEELNAKIDSQNNEFDKVAELTEQYRRLSMTPIVDDDYPEVRHHYESALRSLIQALGDNGRINHRSFYGDVVAFHHKFGLPTPDTTKPRHLTDAEFEFRFKFMHEELAEYNEACSNRDLVKAVDALVDLVYVALGTAAFHGFPFDQVWNAVHAANMTKVRTISELASKRGSTFDVIKPAGWVSPESEIKNILTQLGGDVC